MSGSAAEERIRARAEAELRRNWPGARIIHELVLEQFGRRIDLAAVTPDRLVAVEIKSERDVLHRLKAQIEAALPVSAEVWVCVAAQHEAKLLHCLEPDLRETETWIEVRPGARYSKRDPNPDYIEKLNDAVVLVEHDEGFRVAHRPSGWARRLLDPRALLWMLWADELRRVANLGSRATRMDCVSAALEHLTGRQIRQGVYAALRNRPFPRADDAANSAAIDAEFAVIEPVESEAA